MLIQEASLDDVEEIPVEASVNDENEDFGETVPIVVDIDVSAMTYQRVNYTVRTQYRRSNLRLANRRVKVGGDPDAEDCNVDQGDNHSRSPFQHANGLLTLRNNRNTVNDDLHQQLDLPHP